jgi:hypothetical protein
MSSPQVARSILLPTRRRRRDTPRVDILKVVGHLVPAMDVPVAADVPAIITAVPLQASLRRAIPLVVREVVASADLLQAKLLNLPTPTSYGRNLEMLQQPNLLLLEQLHGRIQMIGHLENLKAVAWEANHLRSDL